ncbi:MAG: hypothetical protein ACOYNS_15555 [Bacteroidota bacterium]
MKKILTISFLLLYVTLSAGVNILIHTCGGESTALIATGTTEDPCGCDDENSADKCCTTELKTLQVDDAQKAAVCTACEPLIVHEVLSFISGNEYSVNDPLLFDQFVTSFSPPPLDDLCIAHSVFRI